MILIDANLLMYAAISTYPQHEAAQAWMDERLNNAPRVGLPWSSLLAFLRVTTNARLFSRPLGIEDAWRQVTEWLACDAVWTPTPTDRHGDILGKLLLDPGVTGNLVPDAHLAALAIEHGLELCSADGDFARFSGLKWSNPLAY